MRVSHPEVALDSLVLHIFDKSIILYVYMSYFKMKIMFHAQTIKCMGKVCYFRTYSIISISPYVHELFFGQAKNHLKQM